MVSTTSLRRNLLLQALPPQSLSRIENEIRVEEVPLGRVIFEAESANDVLFPLDAVVSLLREFDDGSTVEVGMVGPEGVAGINSVLGVPVNLHVGLVQGRGIVGRMKGTLLRSFLQTDPAAREIFDHYIYAFTASTSQLAACNRLHPVVERLAHWLLLLHDRVGSDEMSLTQEFLAVMLGTRRAGINVAMRELKTAGAIDHRRNRVTVRNRELLEQKSCSCYQTMAREYERALGFKPVSHGRLTPVD